MGSTSNVFTDMMEKFYLRLSEEYLESSWTAALIIGFLAFGFTLTAAICIKKGRVLGIITAITQLIGVLGARMSVVNFANTKWFVQKTIIGSSSADVQNQMNQFMQDYYGEVIPRMIWLAIGGALMTFSMIMLLVYIVGLMKVRPKVLPILGLVMIIVRFLFVAPINYFGMLMGNTTGIELMDAAQASWDKINYVVILIPVILIALQGIIYLFTSKKKAPETAPAAAEATESAEATEAAETNEESDS